MFRGISTVAVNRIVVEPVGIATLHRSEVTHVNCVEAAILCEDLGEPSVARGIQIFGKLEILVLSLPLVDKVLELAKELLQY